MSRDELNPHLKFNVDENYGKIETRYRGTPVEIRAMMNGNDALRLDVSVPSEVDGKPNEEGLRLIKRIGESRSFGTSPLHGTRYSGSVEKGGGSESTIILEGKGSSAFTDSMVIELVSDSVAGIGHGGNKERKEARGKLYDAVEKLVPALKPRLDDYLRNQPEPVTYVAQASGQAPSGAVVEQG